MSYFPLNQSSIQSLTNSSSRLFARSFASMLCPGFPVGNTVQAMTKGMWIWAGRHPSPEDSSWILFMDTEGLCDVQKVDALFASSLSLSVYLHLALSLSFSRPFPFSLFFSLSLSLCLCSFFHSLFQSLPLSLFSVFVSVCLAHPLDREYLIFDIPSRSDISGGGGSSSSGSSSSSSGSGGSSSSSSSSSSGGSCSSSSCI